MKQKNIACLLTGLLTFGLLGFAPAAQAASDNPDITDPAKYAQDADDYLLPKSASVFKSGAAYSIGKPAAGGKTVGVVPAGMADFYAQKVSWGKCDDFNPAGGGYTDRKLECGYAIVPLDYNNPAGQTIAIAMMRKPATDKANRIGSLFMNPGGPGGSGLEMLSNRAGSLSDLGKRFDLVSFDPRGVGSSLPLVRCESNAYFDAIRQWSDALSADQKNKVLEAKTGECYRNSGRGFGVDGKQFISNVGTASVIRDLDIMRSVVGDEKLNYYGVSYGTTIGYQYLQQFPNNVRAMISDGVTNPFENSPETYAEFNEYTKDLPSVVGGKFDQTIGFNTNFERFVAGCAKNHGYGSLGTAKVPCAVGEGTLQEQTAEYQKIARKAWGSKAYVAKDGRILSFGDIIKGTLAGLRSENSWGSLNQALYDLKTKNDAQMMMSFADRGYSRNPRSKGYSRLIPTFTAVRCADIGTEPGYNENPSTIIADLKEGYKLAPFSDPGLNADGTQRGLEPEKDRCTYFQAQHTMAQGKVLTDAPRALFISSRFDAPTPYQNAVIAAAASGGALLSVPGGEHGNFEKQFECANKIGLDYLIGKEPVAGESGKPVKDASAGQAVQCMVRIFPQPKAKTSDVKKPTGNESGVSVNTTSNSAGQAGNSADTGVDAGSAKNGAGTVSGADAGSAPGTVSGAGSVSDAGVTVSAAGEPVDAVGAVHADAVHADSAHADGISGVGSSADSAVAEKKAGKETGGNYDSGADKLAKTGGVLGYGLTACALVALLVGVLLLAVRKRKQG